MSLKGDLNDFELREIMHFIGDRMKDGRLMLKAGEQQAMVEFGQGKITRVLFHDKPPLVLRLEEDGFVTAGTATKLADAASDDISQRQLVLSKKLVEKDDLRRFLIREVAKDLAELMFWEEAEFEFINTDEPPPPLVEMKVEDAAREAIAMSVELRNLKKRFPAGASLRLNETPVKKIVTIDPEEWGLVTRFTKKISVEDLAKTSGLNSFSFFEVLARVADHGLLVVDAAEKVDKVEKADKKPEVEAKAEPEPEPEPEPKAAPEPQQKKQQQESPPINGKYVAVA